MRLEDAHEARILRRTLALRTRDVEMREVAPCGIVCATTATRVGAGFVKPEGAVLLQQATLDFCHLPSTPPACRTLLLITRKAGVGRTRWLSNLAQASRDLAMFAESYGLRFQAVNFGEHDFCDQVKFASQAYIMVGIQGADPTNMFFQFSDATLTSADGREFHVQRKAVKTNSG